MSLLDATRKMLNQVPLARNLLRPIVRAGIRQSYAARNLWNDHWSRLRWTASSRGPFRRVQRPRWLGGFGGPPMHVAAEGPSRVGLTPRGHEVVMLVVSDLRIDPRVEREARSLAAAGYSVRVICPDMTQSAEPPSIDWGPGIAIQYLDHAAGEYILHYPGYAGDELYAVAASRKPFAIHAHDLNTAYAALAAANHTGAHLVVDFHEWISENVHFSKRAEAYVPFPPDWKKALQHVEKLCLQRASAAITVCDSIADAMAEELGNGRRPDVVRNIPVFALEPTREYRPLRQQLGLEDREFVLLYQGGLGPSRLLEPIIAALEFAPRCTLVIRGPGLELFGEDYRAIAARAGAADRLVLAGAVPSRDVCAAAKGADCGIWSLPALCRNFTYALPNKLFEYLTAGLPLLVAHHPEARRMVEIHDVGMIFDPMSPASIAAAINAMIDDSRARERFRANTGPALKALDAEREWQKLVTIYDALPRSQPAN